MLSDNISMGLFRSYGSVFKALHKESGQVLAIKQVHVHGYVLSYRELINL